MIMLKIKASKVNELLSEMNKSYGVYAPVEKAGEVDFRKWDEGSELRLDVLKTVKSAKGVFFPQTEDLVSFKGRGMEFEISPAATADEPFVVFGVRACDVRSFHILDNVFLSDPVDSFYKARRENGVVVSYACTEPEETCFCTTFGIDPSAPGGDVEMYISGDEIYLNGATDKGEALLEKVKGMCEDTSDDAVKAQKSQIGEIMKKLPLHDLTTEGWGQGKTDELFSSDKWASLSESCLGCGACTFVCPTCQCYDIRDFDAGNSVRRYRCWDSCMYNDFTMMAHGTPRKTQLERFRQRFMHKLVYYPDNYNGEFSCVGCGRCLAKCPISMNIVKVMKTVGGEKR